MDAITSAISELFIGNAITILLACLALGTLIKGTFKRIPNKCIPYINIIVSICLGFAIPGTFDDRDNVSKVISLIFVGLSSVGVYEILCVVAKERFSIDIESIINKYSGSDDCSKMTENDSECAQYESSDVDNEQDAN